jgi:hypothetical protein
MKYYLRNISVYFFICILFVGHAIAQAPPNNRLVGEWRDGDWTIRLIQNVSDGVYVCVASLQNGSGDIIAFNFDSSGFSRMHFIARSIDVRPGPGASQIRMAGLQFTGQSVIPLRVLHLPENVIVYIPPSDTASQVWRDFQFHTGLRLNTDMGQMQFSLARSSAVISRISNCPSRVR